MTDAPLKHAQQDGSQRDAQQNEWMGFQRRYHAQLITDEAQESDSHVAKRVRCFVSLSDPDLPMQFKGETELLIQLPLAYPEEEPRFDFKHYESRLTAAQVAAIDTAMQQRARELRGTLSLRKLLTWLDNNFYPLLISTGETQVAADGDDAREEKDTQNERAGVQDASNTAPTASSASEIVQDEQDAEAKKGTDNARKPCKFFVRQKCKSGDKCKFSHDVKKTKTASSEVMSSKVDASDIEGDKAGVQKQEAKEDKVSKPAPVESKPKKAKKPRVCRFFARNKCKDGEKCKFLHESKQEDASAAAVQDAKESKTKGIVIKVLKPSAEAIDLGKPEFVESTVAASPASCEEWSEAQQKALDKALKKYPASIDKKIRWISIASEVNGKSLNECIDRFKFLCKVVRDEQPPSALDDTVEKETRVEETGGIDKRIIAPDTRVPIQTEPDVKGSQIQLEDLFLHQIGTLVPHRLVCQVQCNNCPLKFDAKLALDTPSIQKWCPRCSVLHLVGMRPVFAHARSSILAYVDTNENCGVVDVVPSELLAACLECGNEVLFPNVTPLRRSEHACFSCHTKLALMTKRYVVGHLSSANPKGKTSSSSPPLSPKSAKKSGTRKVVENFVLGQPLPKKGTCEHYKNSFRWFRFQCCGKAFPCDVCHDSSDCPQANLGKIASRMICGLCSKEQSSANKECSCGNEVGRKKIVTSHWEGGAGCRNPNMMSQNDKKKFRGLSKTESKKYNRVGVDAKKRREHNNNPANNAQ